MIRQIVDVPLPFARLVGVDWRPDWRGQPPAQGTDGSEQVVFNAFPRWRGAPEMVLRPEMIGQWRALVARARGRVNAYRMRMIDPVVSGIRPPRLHDAGVNQGFRAWEAGMYIEPRPQVTLVSAVPAGASAIVVDERPAPHPVRVGQILSHDDWPFLVEGRSGAGSAVTLQVAMLRKPIPAGASIDLIARGIFLATSDAMGFPAYGRDRVARPQLDLVEWITR